MLHCWGRKEIQDSSKLLATIVLLEVMFEYSILILIECFLQCLVMNDNFYRGVIVSVMGHWACTNLQHKDAILENQIDRVHWNW